MLKIPYRQYALSSFLLVSRFAAHRIRLLTLKLGKGVPLRAAIGIYIILWTYRLSVFLLPRYSPSYKKNLTNSGAISS